MTSEQQWTIVSNPGYAGREPTPLVAKCHDGTPFLTIDHGCGGSMHFHESQLAAIPADVEIAAPCKTCGEVMVFPPGHFAAAFQQMRDEGWIK